MVTTAFGYHIIKVYEKIPATTVKLNDDVKAEVRQYLKNRELQKQMGPFMDQLMKEKHVEILDDRLKPLPDDAAQPPEEP